MGAMRAHTHKHTVWRPRTSPRAGLIRAKDLFGQFDLNGDGKVSKKEFCLALAQIDLDLSPEELSDASRGLDVDGDGTIDYDEMELRQRASRKSRHGRKSESRMEAAARLLLLEEQRQRNLEAQSKAFRDRAV